MTWPYPRIIAHRGGGALAPENTLAAMQRGVSLGFHGVEFDVKLARDAIPFLLHDDTLERTSNGSGAANALTAAELAGLDAGSWFSAEFSGEPIPRFDTVANYLVAHGIWANVEIKPSQGCDAATGTAVALAARELWGGATMQPVLSSFSRSALQAAQLAAPQLARGFLVDAIPDDWPIAAAELECVAVHCSWKQLTPELASAIKSAGYGLRTWTVNEPETARKLFSWGVDAIFTDRLDLIGPDFI